MFVVKAVNQFFKKGHKIKVNFVILSNIIDIEGKNRKDRTLNKNNESNQTKIIKKLWNSFKYVFLVIIILLLFYFYCLYHKMNLIKSITSAQDSNYNINFDFENYERNIITTKIINKAGWLLSLEEAYFINGIIRKFKPKKCLEIGVANGGSSILILNAIKNIDNSYLVSLDLNTKMYLKSQFKTGYRVQKYFPELSKKYRLFTGDLPHKFLVKLNDTFDFLFLDTAHLAPGELLNFIEVLPFLKEKAIMIIHDILWHFGTGIKIYPSNIYLFPNIRGDKILLKKNQNQLGNIGAIILYPKQDKYYLDYFLLLLCFWEYMPTDRQIYDIQKFIKKYYNNNLYLQIFKMAVNLNNKSIKKIIKSNPYNNNNRYEHFMKTLGSNIKNMSIINHLLRNNKKIKNRKL